MGGYGLGEFDCGEGEEERYGKGERRQIRETEGVCVELVDRVRCK